MRLPFRINLPFRLDPGRALFALALAVLLYFVALNETNPADVRQTPFPVPVQVVNVPTGLVITTPPPGIRVWVRSTQTVFNRLGPSSFAVQVDASGAQAGDNDNLPVSVTSTDPEATGLSPDQANVRLQLEEIREQALPVRVNLTGQVPSGYQPGQPIVDPGQIKVAGAASLVGRATEAVVDVSGAVTVSVNGVYTPRILDDRGNDIKDPGLRVTPPSVSVQVPIVQQTQYKEVGIRPQVQGQPAAGYTLQPLEVNPPTTTLAGDATALEGKNFVDTAPIDINGISTTVVRNVALAPSQGTLLLQTGQTVTVTVRVTALAVTQTVRVPPSVVNLSGAIQLARPPDLVSVTISGPAPVLSSLIANPKDFKVTLDVGGKGPGSYTVDVKVQQVPAGLTLDDFQPKQVQVELQNVLPTPAPSQTPSPPPLASGG
ncbi:MAG: CdaR family protein [Chloroflexota bacterium]|nr:CdaR family protein [Chloroflexota bacterium]